MSDFYNIFYHRILDGTTNIDTLIVSDDKAAATERMQIYQNAYLYRLVDVLVDDFPTLQQILGDKDFFTMVQSYLTAHPSQSYTVRELGQHMSRFLNNQPPYKDYPYLNEIAEFEWQKGRTFDGKDAPLFSHNDLANIDLDKLPTATFSFQPTVKRLVFNYNIPQIYKAIQADKLDNEPIKMPQPMAWVMWRKNLDPHWLSLEVDAAWALQQAMQANSFANICGGLSEWIDEDHIPARAAGFIRTWVDEGMLQAINI